MASSKSRRDFIIQSGKAGLGIYAASGILSSYTPEGPRKINSLVTGFQQDPLPYGYNELQEAIDALTMEIHYTKHAAAYASNLQTAAKKEGIDMRRPVEEVLANVSKYSLAVRNNGGGHYNHELFWKLMSPQGSHMPEGKLTQQLTDSFGSLEAFKNQFAEAAKTRFGSGWAWLVLGSDKKLHICSTPNQDNPLMNVSEVKGLPLLGLDVWEHAYYLRYQNKRADYIANWWKVVNWKYVEDRYQSAS
ncbi:MAG: superoxide dismutase [Flavisolibacter sp.]